MTKLEYVARIQNCLTDLLKIDAQNMNESNKDFLKMYGKLTLIEEITNDYIHQVEKECEFK